MQSKPKSTEARGQLCDLEGALCGNQAVVRRSTTNIQTSSHHLWYINGIQRPLDPRTPGFWSQRLQPEVPGPAGVQKICTAIGPGARQFHPHNGKDIEPCNPRQASVQPKLLLRCWAGSLPAQPPSHGQLMQSGLWPPQ
uniref:Uncharacterized protein n=1 Tax=Eutreptiella gymnastica TaxID=73025 RepID=A0A7S4LHF1_9EUGL